MTTLTGAREVWQARIPHDFAAQLHDFAAQLHDHARLFGLGGRTVIVRSALHLLH